jgi:hypothetical protein
MRLDHRLGGVALAAGFALSLVLPLVIGAGGVARLTRDTATVVLVVAVPLLGVGSGLYVARRGPYATQLALFAGSYLGFSGIGMLLSAPAGAVGTIAGGLMIFALAVVGVSAPLLGSVGEMVPSMDALEEQ